MSRQLLSFSPAFMRRRVEVLAPSEVWPPSVTPDMYFDFDANEGYWGGQARTTADMIHDGGDSYRIPVSAFGFTETESYSWMVDYYNDGSAAAATSTDIALAWKATSSNQFTVRTYVSDMGSGVCKRYPNIGQNTPVGSSDGPVSNMTTGLDLATALGWGRYVISREQGGTTKHISSLQGTVNDFGITNTGAQIPAGTKYLYINSAPTTYGDGAPTILNTQGCAPRRIAIWQRALTEAEMWSIVNFGNNGFTMLGDSFLTHGGYRSDVQLLLEDEFGIPVSAFYDGVGGSALTDTGSSTTPSADTRLAAYGVELLDRTLVIVDGSLEVTATSGFADDDAATTVLGFMTTLGHNRLIYMQANPINGFDATEFAGLLASNPSDWETTILDAGDFPNTASTRINYHNANAHLKTALGNRYVSTLPTMLALSEAGDAADQTAAAQGKWGPTYTSDGTHTTEAGGTVLTGLIAAKMIANKWI